ncbi:MAG: DUF2537 domain-containing protein [Pseudonocardiaceae bacterium]|nr:DUF2537 domain-containing protein [Pseudonocardiaceae bacterium]
MELHARAGKAVLRGYADPVEDPRRLGVPDDLVAALHEWARVVETVRHGSGGEARVLVSRRGRALAVRLAAHAGMSVGYADPLEGGVEQIRPVPETRPEPTPWATGLTISAVAAAVALITVVSVAEALAGTSPWASALATVFVAAGLAPSIWLLRAVPVWRWAGYGVAAGIGCGWFVLLLSLLG